MSEFDEKWAEVLVEAEKRARVSGRSDVVDYLQLRASNDTLRTSSIEWLINTFQWLAGESNRVGSAISIERRDAHSFLVGASTMVGTLFTLRRGVRVLTIEAGWPRAPHHRFVSDGGLAAARIKHFGDRAAGEELLLLPSKSGAPQWFVFYSDGKRVLFSEARAHYHVGKLLDR
jgi:hypothetical protein